MKEAWPGSPWLANELPCDQRQGTSGAEPLHVLLIDDDEAFSATMAEHLASEGIVCERTCDPERGLKEATSGRFDAVVLDVMTPRLEGIDILRRLRRETQLPILMLTARSNPIDRVIGLELGADDYLAKPCFPRELAARLRAVLRRVRVGSEPHAGPAEWRVGRMRISRARRECFVGGRPLGFTASEFTLIDQLALRPGGVVTKEELSEQGLRRPYDRSLDAHISRARHKLAAARAGLEIEAVRGIGYCLKVLE